MSKHPNRPGEQNRPPQGQRPSGGDQPAPDALKKFTQTLLSNDFGSEEIMQLADGLGQSLARPQRDQRGDREGKDNTRNQLRKFYNLVREAKASAETEAKAIGEKPSAGRPHTETKIKLRSLQAQVAYAVARRTISPDFKEFFDVSVDKLMRCGDDQLKDSLKHFTVFFESLYAYFYFYTEPARR